MSELRVIIRSDLAPGFALAGVETFGADQVQSAEILLDSWIADGESGLIAVDESLLAQIKPALLRRLRASDRLFHVAIPAGKIEDSAAARQERIAALIRSAIGFHITFRPEDERES